MSTTTVNQQTQTATQSTTPLVETKTKKPRKAKAVVTPVPVVETTPVVAQVVAPMSAPVPVSEPVVAPEVVAPVDEREFSDVLESLSSRLSEMNEAIRALRAEFKVLQKCYRSEKRSSKHKTPKAVDPNAPSKHRDSGITKSVPMTPALRSFILTNGLKDKRGNQLGDDTTTIASTRVTSFLRDYINTNKLRMADAGRYFVPDQKLSDLLNLKTPRFYSEDKLAEDGTVVYAKGDRIPVDKLTYSRLQTFIAPHLIREKPVAVAVSV